jgi:hypothetical protein
VPAALSAVENRRVDIGFEVHQSTTLARFSFTRAVCAFVLEPREIVHYARDD